MSSNWTQPQCYACWIKENPGHTPHRLETPDEKRCCTCDTETRSGIFVRKDPRTVRFPSDETGDMPKSLAQNAVDTEARRVRYISAEFAERMAEQLDDILRGETELALAKCMLRMLAVKIRRGTYSPREGGDG